MVLTSGQLVAYLSHIDRPRHDEVLALVKRAMLLPKLVRPLAATILAYVLLAYLAGMGSKAFQIAGVVGAVMLVITFFDNTVMLKAERKSSRIAMVFAVVGLFCGLVITLLLKKEPLIVLAAGAGGFCVTWIVVMVGIAVLSLVIRLLSLLLRAFSSPIAAPVLAILAKINNRVLRTKYKGWTTSRGTPIIEFGSDGVTQIQHDNEAIFVPSPRFRCGGAAVAAGIPLFTIHELGNGPLVDQRIRAAHQALKADTDEGQNHIENSTFMEYNPSNGLPLVAGIGSVDVMGNAFGTDNYQSYYNTDMGHDSFNTH